MEREISTNGGELRLKVKALLEKKTYDPQKRMWKKSKKEDNL